MKEKIKDYLEMKTETKKKIYLVLDNSEMSEIVLLAVREMKNGENVKFFHENETTDTHSSETLFLIINNEDQEKFEGYKTELLLEKV